MFPQNRFIKRITIDITNRCNLKCIMCPQHRETREPYDLPLDVFKRLADETFPFTEELFLSCAYEPTMSGVFEEVLACIAPFNIPKSAMVTNATLLNREKIVRLIESGLHYLMISVDGARESTYERIRNGAKFEKLVGNLRLLSQLKEENNSPRPELDLTFTLMKSNIDEIPLLVELAASLHIKIVNIKPLQVHLKEMEQEALERSDAPAIKENLALGQRIARDRGISLHTSPETIAFTGPSERPGTVPSGTEASPKCVEPFPSLYIRPNGEVLPCTIWREKPIGDLTRQSFAAIWNDAEYTKLRSELLCGNYRENCRKCCYLVR